MHLQDTSDTLFFVFRGIQHIGTGVDRSGIHTEERKLSYERICHDLECQCCKRLLIGSMTLDLVTVHIGSLNCRDIRRRRHKLYDSVDQLLDTFVLMRRSAADRYTCVADGSFPKPCFQLFDRRLLAFQVFLHQVIIKLADLLHQLCMILLCLIFHVIRDIGDRNVLTLCIIIDVGLHLKQIDNALEVILFTDRKLRYNCILSELCADLLHSIEEIRTEDVHFVDKRHTGNTVSIRLSPDVF